MTTTFQLCNQRRAQNRFLRAVTRSHCAQQRCRWPAAHETSWRVAPRLRQRLTLRGVASRLAPHLLRTWMLGTRARGFPAEPVADFR